MYAVQAPPLAGIQHVGLTVCNVETSEAWYGRVLGLRRLFVEPHPGGSGGYAVVLGAQGVGINVGLDHHPANQGESFDPTRTGLDHVCFQVDSHAVLQEWTEHLDREGVSHSGITPVDIAGMHFGVVNFCDPDGVALELIAIS
jgi:catechol 2,3-dioxygenase-like lactoylglutathione lyase family enzyme